MEYFQGRTQGWAAGLLPPLNFPGGGPNQNPVYAPEYFVPKVFYKSSSGKISNLGGVISTKSVYSKAPTEQLTLDVFLIRLQ